MTEPARTPEQDYLDMSFMLGQVTGLLSKHRDQGEICGRVYGMMAAILEHGIDSGRYTAPGRPTEPTPAMICAVLDAIDEGTHVFTRRNRLAPEDAQHQLCRLRHDEIEILAQFATSREAEDAWRREKATIIARALLATPIAPQ